LYQRSERRWVAEYSLANRYVSGSPLTVIRSGVEPARALEVERLDRHRDHAELFLQRVRDRVVPGAGDVEMRGAAAAVADRKRLVRDEHPERGERDGHPGHDREQHVERSLLGQVEEGERGDAD
jgi:hypothetical protein